MQRAGFELSQFLSLSVSHARRAPAVRSTEILLAGLRHSAAEITLYSRVACRSPVVFPRLPLCGGNPRKIFHLVNLYRRPKFEIFHLAAPGRILARCLLSPPMSARGRDPCSGRYK